MNSAKTECPRGHPYEGANLAVYRSSNRVSRICRTCKAERQRLYYKKKTAGRKAGKPGRPRKNYLEE